MKRLFLFFISAAFFNGPLFSQVVSLKSCLETGLKNNYSLRIVRNEQRIAENNVTRANAGYLPSVNASAGYTGSLDSRNTKNRLMPASMQNGRFSMALKFRRTI